jgi:O-antigen/teichoic acid export membrane protein
VGRDGVRTLFRSPTVRTFGANSAILGLGLLTSVGLARWLGTTGRGEVAAALLWPTLLIYIASTGLISSVLYHSALPESERGTILGTAASLGAIQSALAVGIGYVALPFLLRSQSATIIEASRLFLLVIPLNLLSQYGLSVLQAGMKFSALNSMRLIIPVGYFIGVMLAEVFDTLTARAVVLLHLSLNVVLLFAVLLMLWRYRAMTNLRFDLALAKRLLKYGIQVQAGELSHVANTRMDQTLIAAWLPPAQLGLYVAAVGAANVSTAFTNAVRTVVTPRITQQGSVEGGVDILRAVFGKYLLLSAAGTVVLMVAVPFLIPIVYGASFSAAGRPAVVLVIAGFFFGAKSILAGGAQALGSPWIASRAEIVAVLVTIGGLFCLLPSMGIMGAALASLAAYATQFAVVLFGLARTHDVSPTSLVRRKA